MIGLLSTASSLQRTHIVAPYCRKHIRNLHYSSKVQQLALFKSSLGVTHHHSKHAHSLIDLHPARAAPGHVSHLPHCHGPRSRYPLTPNRCPAHAADERIYGLRQKHVQKRFQASNIRSAVKRGILDFAKAVIAVGSSGY